VEVMSEVLWCLAVAGPRCADSFCVGCRAGVVVRWWYGGGVGQREIWPW
jgi:hypothetical protein